MGKVTYAILKGYKAKLANVTDCGKAANGASDRGFIRL